jgi:hypothetical protein
VRHDHASRTLGRAAIGACSEIGLKGILREIIFHCGSVMFLGAYSNFQEASQAAAGTKKEDYPEDYPVLFWLRPILSEGGAF